MIFELVKRVIEFWKEHGEHIMALLGSAYATAVLFVHITPTPKDDELLGKLYDVVHKAAGFLKVKK